MLSAAVLLAGVALGQADFIDCVGQVLTDEDCRDANHDSCESWIGDGSCDSGFTLTDSDIQMFLNCRLFNNDGGDCDEGGDFGCEEASMSYGDECPDADEEAGEYRDCWGQIVTDADCAVADLGYTTCAQWWADGSCDGGQHLSDADILINWNCLDYNWDGGDCAGQGTRGPTRKPTAFPSTSPTTAPSASPTKSPTRFPSVPPTSTPTVSPTTPIPTASPTIDRWSDPNPPGSIPDDTSVLTWGEQWSAPGVPDAAGGPYNGPYAAKAMSEPAVWSLVDPEVNPFTESYDIGAEGYEGVGAAYLSGWVWVPSGTGAVEISFSSNSLAYVFMDNDQIGAAMASGRRRLTEGAAVADEVFIARVDEREGAAGEADLAQGGRWVSVKTMIISESGIGRIEYLEIRQIPLCMDSKADLCQVWAQNPSMCSDNSLRDFCRLTCRAEWSDTDGDCMLPEESTGVAMFSFENESYQDSLGVGAGVISAGRGGAEIRDDGVTVGGVLYLDGTEGDVGTDMAMVFPATICARVKPAAAVGEEGNMMTIIDASNDCDAPQQGVSFENGEFVMYAGGNSWTTGQVAFPEEWQHFCAVFDVDTVMFYAEGARVFSAAGVTYTWSDNTGNYKIGARCGNDDVLTDEPGDMNFNGMMNDVGIWDTALEMNEINSIKESDKDEGFMLFNGKRVQALADDGFWYPGTITQVNDNDSWDITFDDGDFKAGVTRDRIRALGIIIDPNGYQIRELVNVNRYNLGVFEEALVRVQQANGLYTVEYTSDGAIEVNVPTDRIDTVITFLRGDTVRARQCFWYDAEIIDINPDGKFLVQYLDGSDTLNAVEYDALKLADQITFEVQQFVDMCANDDCSELARGIIIEINLDEDTYDVGIVEGPLGGQLFQRVPVERLVLSDCQEFVGC